MLNRPFVRCAALLGFLALAVQPSIAEHWPRFRGPNAEGVGRADIPATWTDADFRWKVDLPGVGHSSPIVWGKKVFLSAASEEGDQRMLVCIDADSGKTHWVKRFDSQKHKKHRMNSFATSTPAADSERVYMVWASGGAIHLAAVRHDGELAWRREVGPVKGGHGFGVSPIVYKELLILPNDQDGESSLIGIEAATGETRWQTPRQSKRLTYSAPCVYQPAGGQAQLVFTNWQHGITGVDPSTGRVLWEMDVFGKPSPERAIGSPVADGDIVIGSCGFVTKLKHVVALRPSKKGADQPMSELWRIERAVPHVPTILVVDGLAYLWNEASIVTCVRVATGEVVYRERVEGVADTFYSSPVYANGKVFSISQNGTVVAIAAGEEFKVLGKSQLDEVCRSTPAIANGDMLVRTYGRLLCVKGGK